VRTVYMNQFCSTEFRCEVLAEFDLPKVTDKYGDTYTALSSLTSTTPDGEPTLYVERDGKVGYIFVEDIRTISGEEVEA